MKRVLNIAFYVFITTNMLMLSIGMWFGHVDWWQAFYWPYMVAVMYVIGWCTGAIHELKCRIKELER